VRWLRNKADQVARVIAPVPRLVARGMACLMVAVLGFVALSVQAQTTNFPDPTSLYVNAQTPFNSALTWVIGATAVLIVIGWILRAMRGRK